MHAHTVFPQAQASTKHRQTEPTNLLLPAAPRTTKHLHHPVNRNISTLEPFLIFFSNFNEGTADEPQTRLQLIETRVPLKLV